MLLYCSFASDCRTEAKCSQSDMSCRAGVEAAGVRWPELALSADVVAATMHDGVNGEMVRELRALLQDEVFSTALKVRSRCSWTVAECAQRKTI